MLPSARPLPRSCSVTQTTCCGAPCGPLRTARACTVRAGPEQRLELVEVVDHEVDRDAAGLRGVGVPVVPVGRRREAQRRHRLHRADGAAGSTSACSSWYSGQKRSTRPDQQRAAAPARRLEDRLGVLQRQRQRLLQQHVLAGGERALGVLRGAAPSAGRRRPARRGRRRSRRSRSSVDVSAARGRRHLRGLRPGARGDDLHPAAVALRRPGAGVGHPHEAAAEDGDAGHPTS